MLATTQWPLERAVHLTSLVWVCVLWLPESLMDLSVLCIVCSAFWKANIIKVELSIIKIGELLRKLWSLRSCFNILPPGALTPQGIEGAMKRDVSKHWCTLQWCASRGWFIAHEKWTPCEMYLKDNIFDSSKRKTKGSIGGIELVSAAWRITTGYWYATDMSTFCYDSLKNTHFSNNNTQQITHQCR